MVLQDKCLVPRNRKTSLSLLFLSPCGLCDCNTSIIRLEIFSVVMQPDESRTPLLNTPFSDKEANNLASGANAVSAVPS